MKKITFNIANKYADKHAFYIKSDIIYNTFSHKYCITTHPKISCNLKSGTISCNYWLWNLVYHKLQFSNTSYSDTFFLCSKKTSLYCR